MLTSAYRIRTTDLGGKVQQVSMFDPCTARWLASFTSGAHTVILPGPLRTFREGEHVVRHATWVRTYPQPFHEAAFDPGWLALALEANSCGEPDVLALAMQYVSGSAALYADDDPLLQIAGDASYGPRTGDTREEGSDFNDYLGLPWHYDDEATDRPEPRQLRCLDCSGYVRMVFGYRRNLSTDDPANIPLCRSPRGDKAGIPRRAHEIASHAPGVVVAGPSARQLTYFSALAAGDLVFFNADPDDGPQIDHVGIYLGLDGAGHRRFISSRKRANGPTLGDIGGRSILDGDGTYARAFCAARRL
ncbi:MAG TPA: NlpC/P60 family protein [Lysobacter sp.]